MTDTAATAVADHGAPAAADEQRYAVLDKALRRVRYGQDQLIEMLHVAQDVYGYLPDDVLWHLARELRIPPSEVFGVATFYHHFVFTSPGAHTCTVCTGTACFVKGAEGIVRALQEAYGVAPGETTGDGQLTLTTARCLGSCGLAPIVVFDGAVEGHQSRDAALERTRHALAGGARGATGVSEQAGAVVGDGGGPGARAATGEIG